MGSSSSKGQYPYPRQYGNPYGRPYGPPGPPMQQNYHFPNGQYQPGFIPPYGVIPNQQVVWPQQEMPRRRRKTRRHKDSRRESDRDRYVPMPVPHPAAPGPAASQTSHAPVVPTPHPAPAPAPAPTASPAPARGSVRTQTPFPRARNVAEEDDDEDSAPVLPHVRSQSSARARTPIPTAAQNQSMHRAPSRGPREPLYQPQQPAQNLNIASSLEPLPPANPAVFGPSEPRQYVPLDNPLPPPPRDLYESSPYKSLLSLPQTTALLTANFAPKPAAKETKKSRKGIFRAFSSRKHENEEKKETQVHFVPVFVNNPPPGGNPMPPMPAIPPLPQPGPPGSYRNPLAGGRTQHPPREIRYNEDSDYWSFMNHSPHRIYFEDKEWPTATHLIEARKYLPSHPAIADEIRLCGDVAHVYPISANYQQFQDPHWSENHMQILEDILYLKFSQHADLRSTLWETEDAHLIYEDRDDPYWGVGPMGDGANVHGTLLERVRARLLEGRIPQQ